MYARSDVLHVALSRVHGGCGEAHTRPVVNGAPVKDWALDCVPCEKHLKTDVLWAGMPSETPETPDEVKIREDQDRRGQRDAISAQAQALQKIADLPEGIATALAQAFAMAFSQMQADGRTVPAQLAPAETELRVVGASPRADCPNGHPNLASAKFCGECGTSVLPPLDLVVDPEPLRKLVEVPAEFGLLTSEDLDRKSLADLKKIAAHFGLKLTNSRDKQAALIREYFAFTENGG